MNIQQAPEGHFNPASPHSSSGGADSYKGTPDTRLTTFSPEDGSVRSMKMLGSLTAGAREAGPITYPSSAPQTLEKSNVFYRTNLHMDKDPFISPSDPGFKPGQKLSPTASVFSPLPSSLVVRSSGSASEPKRGPDVFSEGLGQNYGQNSEQSSPRAGITHSEFVHDQLSTDSGLSRCLIVSAKDGGRVTVAALEIYLSVRSITISTFVYIN